MDYGFLCHQPPFAAQCAAFVFAFRVSQAEVYFVVLAPYQALSPVFGCGAKLNGLFLVSDLFPPFALQVESQYSHVVSV